MSNVKINFHGLSNRRFGSDFTLAPGENTVSAETWKKWEKHPQIAPLVTNKTIEVEEVKSAETTNTGSDQVPTGSGGSLLGRNRS